MRIDRFLITAQIHKGKHATVLQARDNDGLFVALKLARTGVGAGLVDREARLLGALDGNATAASEFVSTGSADGRPYTAWSWRRGTEVRTVSRELRNQGADAEVLELCCRLTQAYTELHACGVLHGAVHPRHVLVDTAMPIALLDFTLAAVSSDRPPGTLLAASFSSLSAPEHARALLRGEAPTPGTATEQYSLAALLYLLLTGRMYAHLRLERRTLANDIIRRPPLRFADQGLYPWPELEVVLGRALEKDPSRRYPSIAHLQRALECLGGSRPAAQRRAAVHCVQAPLAQVLETFRRTAGSQEALAGLGAPRCSVNLGAAGVALALSRIGKIAADPTAFEVAERWLCSAESARTAGDAFDDGEELTPTNVGLVSPHHCASGLAAARAFLSEAMGDSARQEAALDDFRAASDAPCANVDLTIGRSSVLLVGALLYSISARDWAATQRLEKYGDELCESIWRDLGSLSMRYYGIAHGWAGVAYATLMWACARGIDPPAGVRSVLDRLVSSAEPYERGLRWPLSSSSGVADALFWPGWCHGNAGYVFLWNLAAAVYGEPAFADFAERAAQLICDDTAVVSNLCCGAAGQIYAALNQYRNSDTDQWRKRAAEFANRFATDNALGGPCKRPLSLYKGHIGLALLAIELESPRSAAMPLFEFEPAS